MVPSAAATVGPSEVFITDVSALGRALLVSWSPSPAAEQVMAYTVRVSPAATASTTPSGCEGPFSVAANPSSTAAEVPGLCEGVAYQATVQASDAAGPGAPGTPSNPIVVLPAQPPSAPVLDTILARDSSLVVSWSAPASTGGDPISGYDVTAQAEGAAPVLLHVPTATYQATVSGLTNATAYRVDVVAQNALGASAASSGTGTPAAIRPPSSPRDVSAVPDGSGAVAVSWRVPQDDGGSSINDYTVTVQRVQATATEGAYEPDPTSAPVVLVVAASSTSTTIAPTALQPQNALYAVSVAAGNAMGQSQAASTAAPVSPATGVKATTKVLSAATIDMATSDVDGVITWPAPAPAEAAALSVGDVAATGVSVREPGGFLRKVTAVEPGGDGSLVLRTQEAALDDAFDSLAFATSSNPLVPSTGGGSGSPAGAAAPLTLQPMVPGVRVMPQAGVSPQSSGPSLSYSGKIVLSVNLEEEEPALAVTPFVKGEITLEPKLELDTAISKNRFGFPDGFSLQATGLIKTTEQVTFGIAGSKKYEKTLFTMRGSPIDIQVGPVPVVVVPVFKLTLKASGQMGLMFSMTQQFGGTISWNSHHADHLGFTDLSDMHVGNADYAPSVSAFGEAKVELEASVAALLYDLGGPAIAATGGVSFKGTSMPDPGKGYVSLTPSVKLSIKLEVERLLFFKGVEVSYQIAEHTFDGLQLFKVPAPTLSISPAPILLAPEHEVTLTTKRSDGDNSHPVRWSLENAAGDTISPAGLLRAAGPVGRRVRVLADDGSGAKGRLDVTIGYAPFDAPTDLVATQRADGTSELTWTPPVSSGGTPVSRYVITGEGVTALVAAGDATSARLPKLRRGTSHVLFLSPRNSSGQTGPSALTVLSISTIYATVDLVSASNPSVWARGVDLTASVRPVGETIAPTGQVVIADGAKVLGTFPLPVDGGVHLAAVKLTPGSHTLTARYLGDDSYGPSGATPLKQEVADAVEIPMPAGFTNSLAFGVSGDFVAGIADNSVGVTRAFGYDLSSSLPARDLGTLGGGYAFAYAVNGSVVVGESGTADGGNHAFAYDMAAKHARMLDLGAPGDRSSIARAVSGHVVVGRFSPIAGDQRAFAYDLDDASHTMRDLGTLGGAGSDAVAISGSLVVGYSTTASGESHAFVYDLSAQQPVMRDLGTLGGTMSRPVRVDGTRIVGYSAVGVGYENHAFVVDLSQGGVMRDLGTTGQNSNAVAVAGNFVAGYDGSSSFVEDLSHPERGRRLLTAEVKAVTQSGIAVGKYDADPSSTSNVPHGFALDAAATTPVLRDLGTFGGLTSYVEAADGQYAVGEWRPGAGGSVNHALIWNLAPTVSLTASAPVTSYPDSLDLAVSVLPVDGPKIPSGTVTVYDGTTPLATVSLAGGKAALHVAAERLSPGTHALRASYSGDADNRASRSLPLPHQVEFTDVRTTSQFGPDIYWLANQKLANGFTDGTFRPTNSVTRQAFAAYLYRYAHDGVDAGQCAAGTSIFNDVPDASAFCGDIKWLAGTGITGGFPDGGFHPAAPVARQAAAAFFYRFNHGGADAGQCAAGTSPFNDVPATSPFCGDIKWLATTSPTPITTGFADGGFHPTAPVARQAAAAYFHRYDSDFVNP